MYCVLHGAFLVPQAFHHSDTTRIDTRTQLPIVEPPEQQVKHFPSFFRDGSTSFYFWGHVKKTTSKGKLKGCIVAISDQAVYTLTLQGDVKRCIPVGDIDELVADYQAQTLALRVPNEYDIQFQLEPRMMTDITNILTQWFKVCLRAFLKASQLPPNCHI